MHKHKLVCQTFCFTESTDNEGRDPIEGLIIFSDESNDSSILEEKRMLTRHDFRHKACKMSKFT